MRDTLLAGCLVFCLVEGSVAQEFHSESPPFRVTLLSLHRQRDLMLVRGPWVWVDDEGAQRPIENRTPKSRTSGGADFFARLRVTTDPPTFFRQDGPPRLEEAIDDLDQTLEPFEEPGAVAKRAGASQRSTYATRDVRLALSLPEQPAKTIKRLKGTIPVALSVRSPQPVSTLDLSRGKGQSARVGDARVSLLDVKVESDRSASLKLLVKLESEKGDERDKEYQERVAARLVDVVQRQIDLVDDQTRPVVSYATTTVRRNEARASLKVRPDDAFGAPDRLRIWGLTRSVKEIPFEFKNVPLP
ncbi:MAG: hypothetical protein P4L84_36770 [Isosphaeraceae bacterium]|nr:hypothetical protein [Isosphaeraceae bacterium]